MFKNTTERERERKKDERRLMENSKIGIGIIVSTFVAIIFSKLEFDIFIKIEHFIYIRRGEWFFSLTRSWFTEHVDFENWVNESIISEKKRGNGSSRSRAVLVSASNIIRSPFLIQLIGASLFLFFVVEWNERSTRQFFQS